jgi:hypothetical protein
MILKHSIKVRQRLSAKSVILAFSGTLLLAAPVAVYMLEFGHATNSLGASRNNSINKATEAKSTANQKELPVKIVSCKGQQTGEYILLTWTTAFEKDNSYFLLQKSNDGINFTDLGKVNGAGTSNTMKNYHLLDVKPASGINYYRLKQADGKDKQNILQTMQVNMNNL